MDLINLGCDDQRDPKTTHNKKSFHGSQETTNTENKYHDTDHKTHIHNLNIERSTEVQVGNSLVYNGPVTIKQFIVDDKFKVTEQFKSPNGCFGNRKKIIFWSIAVTIVVLLIIMIVIFCVQAFRNSGENELNNFTLNIIDRDEWYGEPANYTVTLPLELPSTRVIIIHTVTEQCFNLPTCGLVIRNIQKLHMHSYDWDDIGYNFLVGDDGRVYVGRGWKMEGVHTLSFNKRSIGLAFIGDFSKIIPSKNALMAAQKLIGQGVNQDYLSKNYKLLGHRQLIQTESPGQALYAEIQKWPHWTPNVHGD